MSINTTEENGKLIIFLQGRIDTQNAPQVEKELKEILNANEGRNFELDAEELEYISSAGLRILMKLRQMKKDSYPIRNVSSGVYDILEMTGFIELFDVQKALRKISIEGLEEIGRGATAKVYRLDRETVLKVYRPDTDLNIIHNENERTKNAFVNGIPTAIAFDIVKVGDCYGNVYELLDAEDFLTVLLRDKEHLEEHIRRFANDMRSMHQIEVNPFKFPPTKTGSIQALSFLEGICTKEELRKLKSLYENIPSRNTFLTERLLPPLPPKASAARFSPMERDRMWTSAISEAGAFASTRPGRMPTIWRSAATPTLPSIPTTAAVP